jgi:predicted metal-dependent hydrolase
MPLDWEQGGLAEGLRCYRNREFFEAHEHWEAVWLRSAEPEKTFLQALIQTTAAFHHFQRRNFVGAASLLRGALRRLEPYPAEYGGGVAVEELRQSIRAWLASLEQNVPAPDLAFPEIK